MITLIAFFIDTKLNADASAIYIGTFILDICLLQLLCKIFGAQ